MGMEASGGTSLGVALIVGLGNPGVEYQFTPHNAGFLAIDRIAERCGSVVANRRCKALTATTWLAGRQVVLAKPETFMNLSGLSIGALTEELGIDGQRDMIVLYDEVELPLGTIRVRERGGPGGHNGVKSIIATLGTEEWMRVRIGTGPEEAVAMESVRRDRKDYVLTPFRNRELAVLDSALNEAADAVESILRDGVAAAMNKFNRRARLEEQEQD